MKLFKLLLAGMLAVSTNISAMAKPDPNFHIYICIGQSNMEGNAAIQPFDRLDVPQRFKVMATVDFKDPQRSLGEWYVACPPLVRENTGLTPMDYFGRTMLDNLPDEISVGVVPVAVGGCRIEHLFKDYDSASVSEEAEWFKAFMKAYDNHPYRRLIECAKKAQEKGVIKGILLHQGESNNGDKDWCKKVKRLYDDILSDLGLEPGSIPLLAGEMVRKSQGGICGDMNAVIATLPATLQTARVVSTEGLAQKGDGLHFTAHTYRVLGCRYALEMLETMGVKDPYVAYSEQKPLEFTAKPRKGDYVFDFNDFIPSIWGEGTFDSSSRVFSAGRWGFGGWEFENSINLSGYRYLVAELDGEDTDDVELRVFDTASYLEKSYEGKFGGGKLIVAELNGMMKRLETGIVALDTSKVYRIGFWGHGKNPIRIKHVFATNNNPYDSTEELKE